jgi:SAM-dependent methyltransferase
MQGYGPASYGDGFADVYDDWYADVSDVGATVARLAALADGGTVLELGIGSGRIALPLAARGIDVWGIDASAAMVDRLRSKPGGDTLPVAIGDMAELDLAALPGGGTVRFDLVFAVYNTFLNLPSEAEQRRCLAAVADRLAVGGRMVIEAFVPSTDAPRTIVDARVVELDRVVLSVSRERTDQVVDGQHIEITERGVRLRPWRIRYLVPEQLDALAADAGLTLLERWSSWDGTRYEPGDAVQISIYGGR